MRSKQFLKLAVAGLFLTNQAFADSHYQEARKLFVAGTPVSADEIPEYALAETIEMARNALEASESRFVFTKSLDANGKVIVRMSHATKAIANEDLIAHFTACNGMVPSASLDQNKNLVRFWSNYAGLRYIESFQSAMSQANYYLRKVVRDNVTTFVGRIDINEPGFSFDGLEMGSISDLEKAYFTFEAFTPVVPSNLPHKFCAKVLGTGWWQRVNEATWQPPYDPRRPYRFPHM